MNRIETKIVIMVTNRLAAAKDSDAKMELIEELSENLYQRYQDLTAAGVSEEEALAQAMDSLGDVKELLAYLKEEAKGQAAEKEQERVFGKKSEIRSMEKTIREAVESTIKPEIEAMERAITEGMRPEMEAMEKEMAARFRTMEKGMGAMDADSAAAFAEDVEAEEAAGFAENVEPEDAAASAENHEDEPVHTQLANIRVEDIHTVKLDVRRGDVEVSVIESLNLIDICTESDDLDVFEETAGVLVIRQKQNKNGFFARMAEKSVDVELGLPAKLWQRIELKCASGQITVNPNLKCRELEVVSASSDMEIWQAQAEKARLRSASGSVTAQIQCESLWANSVSGDVEINESECRKAEISTVSGDASLELVCEESLTASTVSGDLEISLAQLPKSVKASTVSGDSTIQVPKDCGFSLQYKTASGDFTAENMALSGIMKGKGGNVTYLDGGDVSINMSSVSGDMQIGTA